MNGPCREILALDSKPAKKQKHRRRPQIWFWNEHPWSPATSFVTLVITTGINSGPTSFAQEHVDAIWAKLDPDLVFPGGSCPVSTCRYDLNEISAFAELQTGIAGERSRLIVVDVLINLSPSYLPTSRHPVPFPQSGQSWPV